MDVVEISKSKPLSLRISPLSAPTLSQIEGGVTLPSLSTMHALSVVYRVSTQHFLNLMVEERLVGEGDLPETSQDTETAFQDAVCNQAWQEALSLCIHGERLAPSEDHRIVWRSRRASYLGMLGMRDEAISILMDCSARTELSPATRRYMQATLVSHLISQGLLPMAEALLKNCLSDVDLEPSARIELLRQSVRLVIERETAGLVANDREFREALETISELEACPDQPSPDHQFLLKLFAAGFQHSLGNRGLALRELRELQRVAEEEGNTWKKMQAGLYLGLAVLAVGNNKEAQSILEEVASVASGNEYNDEAFAAYFELAGIPGMDVRSRTRFLRRCGRIAPLVTHRNGRMKAFEAMQAQS